MRDGSGVQPTTRRIWVPRRAAFVAFTLATAAVGAAGLAGILSADSGGLSGLEFVVVGLYALLLSWISANFWISVFGAAHLWARRPTSKGRDPSSGAVESAPSVATGPRVAVVVPIFNEDPDRVFDGVAAMYDSLKDTGCLGDFHLFVLSDTRDPDTALAEEQAWMRTCRRLGAGGSLFYRRRRDNSGRKSGNVAEFCRRWGRRYDYMIVLDADSLVAGSTMVEMVRRMDADPSLGLLQAWPRPVRGVTLFARMQQFSAVLYGRLVAAGMGSLLMDQGNYWGHNAILRVRAFMENCGLPHLPGREPMGGEILSHDFVEAALLVRGGWKVRLATDLGCSYEEGPPNLLQHLKRDRRWCQGNMQHARLLLAQGLHPVSRANFFIGIMAYASAPLWLLFLTAATLEAALRGDTAALSARFLANEAALLGETPILYGLLAMTATFLLMPKILGLMLALVDCQLRPSLGGGLRLTASVILETAFSALLAPVMMLLHTRFVGAVLNGRTVRWTAQQRDAERIRLREAITAHGEQTLVGVSLATVLLVVWPPMLLWLSPVFVGLVLAPWLSAVTSYECLGRAARRLGLFVIPEEQSAPPILERLTSYERLRPAPAGAVAPPASAVLEDPFLNAVHIAMCEETQWPAELADAETLRRRHAQAFVLARHYSVSLSDQPVSAKDI